MKEFYIGIHIPEMYNTELVIDKFVEKYNLDNNTNFYTSHYKKDKLLVYIKIENDIILDLFEELLNQKVFLSDKINQFIEKYNFSELLANIIQLIIDKVKPEQNDLNILQNTGLLPGINLEFNVLNKD